MRDRGAGRQTAIDPQNSHGAPDLDWFYVTGSNTYRALQFDFTWGIAVAKPELTPDQIPAVLK